MSCAPLAPSNPFLFEEQVCFIGFSMTLAQVFYLKSKENLLEKTFRDCIFKDHEGIQIPVTSERHNQFVDYLKKRGIVQFFSNRELEIDALVSSLYVKTNCYSPSRRMTQRNFKAGDCCRPSKGYGFSNDQIRFLLSNLKKVSIRKLIEVLKRQNQCDQNQFSDISSDSNNPLSQIHNSLFMKSFLRGNQVCWISFALSPPAMLYLKSKANALQTTLSLSMRTNCPGIIFPITTQRQVQFNDFMKNIKIDQSFSEQDLETHKIISSIYAAAATCISSLVMTSINSKKNLESSFEGYCFSNNQVQFLLLHLRAMSSKKLIRAYKDPNCTIEERNFLDLSSKHRKVSSQR